MTDELPFAARELSARTHAGELTEPSLTMNRPVTAPTSEARRPDHGDGLRNRHVGLPGKRHRIRLDPYDSLLSQEFAPSEIPVPPTSCSYAAVAEIDSTEVGAFFREFARKPDACRKRRAPEPSHVGVRAACERLTEARDHVRNG
ncbi:hypothetical protein [Streptomyces nanshensis]|uniref:hypothetical protein n=1 Tax=Streptomyces nanshensis TaxID=518642 RepID=UPI00114CB6AC|nr:hypothetical protein [Streptomyces nanshensis]